jgi:hypothetical protein
MPPSVMLIALLYDGLGNAYRIPARKSVRKRKTDKIRKDNVMVYFSRYMGSEGGKWTKTNRPGPGEDLHISNVELF